MIHQIEVQVLILLMIAAGVGMAARRVGLPYTLALVIAGLGLGFVNLGVLKTVELTPDLLLLIFLPPLLFEAAYHLPFDDLKKNRVHISALAIVGVLVSVSLTALLSYGAITGMNMWSGFRWVHALLFASVIAATDPISVLALFKELGAPKRLYQVVEGESLINDGIAVVVFTIVAAVFGIAAGHGSHEAPHGAKEIIIFALLTFIKTGLGGVLVGAGAGVLASVATRQVDDHLMEIVLTILLAWGSFLLAEEVGVSGVLSTVTAGITMGSFGKNFGMSASTRLAVRDFWETMGFLSNSFIFLLIGLELEPSELFRHLPIIVVGFVAVLLSRAAFVYSAMPALDRLAEPLPVKWRHVLVWGGLRGSLSMVLVVGLPSSFEGRDILIHLVFGVVSCSLFIQGLTMAPLMKKLGISAAQPLASGHEYEMARGQAIAFRQVLHEADTLAEQHLIDEPSYKRIKAYYEHGRASAKERARLLAGNSSHPEKLLEGVRRLALIERDAINHATHDGLLSSHVGAELQRRIDVRLDSLDQAAHEGEEQLLAVLDKVCPTDNPD